MIKYVVEGYNSNDYISNFYVWDTLCIMESMTDAGDYIMKLPNGYVTRIVEKDPFETDLDNRHWDIYVG